MTNIAILGGTFDPIHFGHLRMGQEILNIHGFSKIHFVPCFIPVHRQHPIAPPTVRLAMLELALKNEPRFVADDIELKRKEPSYTIDTLRSYHQDMPSTQLYLLVGVDAFLHYLSWKEPRDILQLANIIVTHRPNYQLPAKGAIIDFLRDYQTDDMANLHQKKSGCVFLQPITPLDISARLIRNEISTHNSPRFLLPDDVYRYIQDNKLYLSSEEKHESK